MTTSQLDVKRQVDDLLERRRKRQTWKPEEHANYILAPESKERPEPPSGPSLVKSGSSPDLSHFQVPAKALLSPQPKEEKHTAPVNVAKDIPEKTHHRQLRLSFDIQREPTKVNDPMDARNSLDEGQRQHMDISKSPNIRDTFTHLIKKSTFLQMPFFMQASVSAAASFVDIPEPLLCRIFGYLSGSELCSVSCVCMLWTTCVNKMRMMPFRSRSERVQGKNWMSSETVLKRTFLKFVSVEKNWEFIGNTVQKPIMDAIIDFGIFNEFLPSKGVPEMCIKAIEKPTKNHQEILRHVLSLRPGEVRNIQFDPKICYSIPSLDRVNPSLHKIQVLIIEPTMYPNVNETLNLLTHLSRYTTIKIEAAKDMIEDELSHNEIEEKQILVTYPERFIEMMKNRWKEVDLSYCALVILNKILINKHERELNKLIPETCQKIIFR